MPDGLGLSMIMRARTFFNLPRFNTEHDMHHHTVRSPSGHWRHRNKSFGFDRAASTVHQAPPPPSFVNAIVNANARRRQLVPAVLGPVCRGIRGGTLKQAQLQGETDGVGMALGHHFTICF